MWADLAEELFVGAEVVGAALGDCVGGFKGAGVGDPEGLRVGAAVGGASPSTMNRTASPLP